MRQIDKSLIERFGREGSAILVQGSDTEAKSLLPKGQDLEQIRAVLKPMMDVLVADDRQQTLAQQKTLGQEEPQLGRSV